VGNVGIEDIANVQTMSVYPNPTEGQAAINLYVPVNIKGKLYVTDITGKIVSTLFTGIFVQGNIQYPVQAQNWSGGIYFLVWETDEWKISKKLQVN
jgi:hypothetical protein